jgi:methylphosphotriester-DNA--protein-cysteine methyltransferase
MIKHSELNSAELRAKIRHGSITVAGNEKLKIYGSLHCSSGRRMKKHNRIFFTDEKQAITHGYRPCGHCMKNKYLEWRSANGLAYEANG